MADRPEDGSEFLENVTFDEMAVGQAASLSRTLKEQDVSLFAVVSGDVNPAHMDREYAEESFFHGVIGHGMWSGALISTLLGTVLPGPGTIYLGQNLTFRNPVRLGDTVTAKVTVREKRADKPVVTLDCLVKNNRGDVIVEGCASVLAPREKIRRRRIDLPDVHLSTHDGYDRLVRSCEKRRTLRTAVVHPVDAVAIRAVQDAVDHGLMEPVLYGPRKRIEQAAEEAEIDLSPWERVETEHSHEAAFRAACDAGAGRVRAIMKGAIHTEELLGAILSAEAGLRTEKRISHAYVMDVPGHGKNLILSDAAINIAPDLWEKADICQNAINLFHVMADNGEVPNVAILAAVEKISPKMQATLDAASLCKMAERGQITGGLLDGPLAFDNAISPEAAAHKRIHSPVAGQADILIVPDIEAGNMLAKQLTFLSNADAAGIVMGARVPVILTSRADSLRTRLMSAALAVRVADARAEGKIK